MMNNINRINNIIDINLDTVKELFKEYDESIEVYSFSHMKEGMNNTNLGVSTSKGKFFLKLYSKPTDKAEMQAYTYLKNVIDVPSICYYDGTKNKYPFSFSITEFVEGITLNEYARFSKTYPLIEAYEVGKILAKMQERKFPFNAILDENINEEDKLPTLKEAILIELNKVKNFKKEIINEIKNFIDNNEELFEEYEKEHVIVHDDLHYGNIIISKGKNYFVDFEFGYIGTKYADIGHFFRRKDKDIEDKINEEVYKSFEDGYNSISNSPLKENWLRYARIADIYSELKLINNHENMPEDWAQEIENEIILIITGAI